MEIYATVIHFRGLVSIKLGIIHQFQHKKLPEPSKKYDSRYLLTSFDWDFDFTFAYKLWFKSIPQSPVFLLFQIDYTDKQPNCAWVVSFVDFYKEHGFYKQIW